MAKQEIKNFFKSYHLKAKFRIEDELEYNGWTSETRLFICELFSEVNENKACLINAADVTLPLRGTGYTIEQALENLIVNLNASDDCLYAGGISSLSLKPIYELYWSR